MTPSQKAKLCELSPDQVRERYTKLLEKNVITKEQFTFVVEWHAAQYTAPSVLVDGKIVFKGNKEVEKLINLFGGKIATDNYIDV